MKQLHKKWQKKGDYFLLLSSANAAVKRASQVYAISNCASLAHMSNQKRHEKKNERIRKQRVKYFMIVDYLNKRFHPSDNTFVAVHRPSSSVLCFERCAHQINYQLISNKCIVFVVC